LADQIHEIAVLRQNERARFPRCLKDRKIFGWDKPEFANMDRLNGEALNEPLA